MVTKGSPTETYPAIWRYLVLTAFFAVVLVVLLILTNSLEQGMRLGFLVPYQQWIVLAEIIVLGVLAVESGRQWVYAVLVRRLSQDNAAALRIIARILAYGILLSIAVSTLMANPAGALTLGSFAGLVVGLASQTVMGNTLAGVFLAISRPIRVGDRVTIGGNSGKVLNITLMHTVLDGEDREIMIPSSNIITSVLVRHKDTSGA